MKIIVAQIGAREHFLVARALHQQGLLAGLVTDWYAFARSAKQKTEILKTEKLKEERGDEEGEKGTFNIQHSTFNIQRSVVRRLSSVIRHPSALAAHCDAIPDGLVRAFPFRSLLWKWRVRRLATQGRLYEAYAQTDGAFAAAVARLKLPPHEVFFGYSYASLEMLAAEKQRGVLTVLDQIDPGPVEFRLVAEEMTRHPELAGPSPAFPAANFDRNRREWELADVIVVNSEWSREAIIAEGADSAKIEILPLAFEAENRSQKSEVRSRKSEVGVESTSPRPSPQSGEGVLPSTINHQPSTAPLRVLWLGQVNVRKGIHYLMEAARLLERKKIHFDVVGPIGILPGAVASAPGNMTFHGCVSRDRAAEWYRQSDVFVLPTLSDGFALTQLEALANGLPLIVTPNCGRVVENEKTGFIIPPRDSKALADALLRFVRQPELAREMSSACREAVKGFSIDTYSRRLVSLIKTRMDDTSWPRGGSLT